MPHHSTVLYIHVPRSGRETLRLHVANNRPMSKVCHTHACTHAHVSLNRKFFPTQRVSVTPSVRCFCFSANWQLSCSVTRTSSLNALSGPKGEIVYDTMPRVISELCHAWPCTWPEMFFPVGHLTLWHSCGVLIVTIPISVDFHVRKSSRNCCTGSKNLLKSGYKHVGKVFGLLWMFFGYYELVRKCQRRSEDNTVITKLFNFGINKSFVFPLLQHNTIPPRT